MALGGRGVVVLLAAVVLGGCTGSSGGDVLGEASSAPSRPVTSPPVTTTRPAATPKPTPTSTLDEQDQAAGLVNRKVPWSAGGTLQVVSGSSPAPGTGRVYEVRVEVEKGIQLDRQKFATFVLATLNDERSWTENGRRRFARTDGDADIRVVLASPEKSAAICAPLRTFGKLSCRHGDEAVLTTYRWVKGIPEYADNLEGYRHYVVNHEVGHVLGHAHEYCAGKGKRAPVMMQQTKGLLGCEPNPWPFPDR